MLNAHAAACLEKNWEVLGDLLGLISKLLGCALFTWMLKRRTHGLLRMAEGFARRLLVLRAASVKLAAPCARTSKPQKPPRTKAPAARVHTLNLAEPLPGFPALDEEQPSFDWMGIAADGHRLADPAPALARLAALERLMAQPEKSARRMARFLMRLRKRTGRSTPFCLRRPPGSTRRPADPLLDRHLLDADFFARRVLAPG